MAPGTIKEADSIRKSKEQEAETSRFFEETYSCGLLTYFNSTIRLRAT